MTEAADTAIPALDALTRRFVIDHPREAARRIEGLPAADVAPVLAEMPAKQVAPLCEHLVPGAGEALLAALPEAAATAILGELDAGRAAALIAGLGGDVGERLLSALDPTLAREVRALVAFPPDTAGHLMDTRVAVFRGQTTVDDAVRGLRRRRPRPLRQVLLVDDDNRLSARVPIDDLVVAEGDVALSAIARPPVAVVSVLDPREEVVALLDRHKLDELPVLDADGRVAGVIRYAGLISVLQEEATVDVQTMVGASREERALSSALFAVRKRQPWLQINLLTAFLAAAVVGLFEDTIARITALAVLLPVVAGQSGNAGAQALAVTMRGLALREITVRHWLRVTSKETMVGLLNGLGIAATTAIGVYVWSGTPGLALVIAISMVLSMVAAGTAGALVPIMLKRLGQDPAQSSSIVLTTVTDIAGFFSFLGIATALQGMLV